MAKRRSTLHQKKLPRTRSLRILLNDREFEALNTYCQQRKQARASFVREAIMTKVIGGMEYDVPLLFAEEEMR